MLLRTLYLRRRGSGPPDNQEKEKREEALPTAEVFPRAVEHLSSAVQYPTVSGLEPGDSGSKEAEKAFAEFPGFLRNTYRRVFSELELEFPSERGMLLRWPGRDSAEKPVLFTAHYDVVPAADEQAAGTKTDSGTEGAAGEGWLFPPFSGIVTDEGWIWGRGTLDNKIGVISLLEAVESLLSEGFVPRTDIYFAFGGDEETKGKEGAGRIAAELERRGLEFRFLLDEGMVITRGFLPGMRKAAALIGVAEKGYVDLELTAEDTGGHSSMPPPRTALGRIASVLAQLESRKFPLRMTSVVRRTLEHLVPAVSFGTAFLLSNLWFFGPLVLRILDRDPTTSSLIRTTVAATMAQGSSKENVLPSRASAVLNIRILAGETVVSVLQRIKETAEKENVQVRYLNQDETDDPIESSSIEGEAYSLIADTVCSIFPDTLAVPFLMNGTTDSSKYRRVAKNIYRFTPVVLDRRDVGRIHGTNERLGSEALVQSIRFYQTILGRC
ncbi:MAG: M20/M25/M40 family metallo-hydrolase [Spirochaetales bacterium]|nr:M20/M25/M40 family metallo-hydrolase [Spirochaetales bacterium]